MDELYPPQGPTEGVTPSEVSTEIGQYGPVPDLPQTGVGGAELFLLFAILVAAGAALIRKGK